MHAGKAAHRIGDTELQHGLGALSGVTLKRKGLYRFQAVVPDAGLSCLSNPVCVKEGRPRRTYWGEFHGHTGLTDGMGDVEDYFTFARDKAFLDFLSLSDHDLLMTPRECGLTRKIAREKNQPGKFLTYLGYEWTQDVSLGGHHNVFFRNFHGRWATICEAASPDNLFRRLQERNDPDDVLVIPHCHMAGNWTFHNPAMEKLVEIYSMHGSFEYFGKMFLNRGYPMGLMAASDDHTGHPGFTSPGFKETNGGLMAVHAHSLDRNLLFDAMKARHAYGTTGPRIYLDVLANGKSMGDEVPADGTFTMEAEAAGTAPIASLDVVKNGRVVHSRKVSAKGAGDTPWLRLTVGSTARAGTPDQPANPKQRLTWDGILEIDGTAILSTKMLVENPSREWFRKIGPNRFQFYVGTRGDTDALLLELEDATNARARLWIRARDMVAQDYAKQTRRHAYDADKERTALRSEGMYFEIAITDCTDQPFQKIIHESYEGRVALQNIAWRETGLIRLRWSDPQPRSGDYYYLRVRQVDGEMAWSSPVWVQ